MYKAIVALLLVVAALGAAYLVSLNKERSWGEDATSTPAALSQFSSEHVGLSFSYPNIYEATTTHLANAGEDWHVVTLLPRGYVAPEDGDGPAAISVQAIPNLKNLSAEEWVKTDSRSNWQLAAQDGGLGSITVGGEQGLAYKYSGLYETSAVAVPHNRMIYFFTGDYMTQDDRLRTDFAEILKTVEFTN